MQRLLLLMAFVFSISMFLADDKPAPDTSKPQKEEKKEDVAKEEVKKAIEIDYKNFVFVTDKGNEIKATNLICGVIRKMNKGEKYIQGYTSSKKPIYAQKWHREEPVWESDVPVIDGYIFGAMLNIETLRPDETLVIDMVDTPPNEFELNGVKTKQIKQSFGLTKGGKRFHLVTTFKKEEPYLMQYGTWKKEFYNNGKLIFSYNFNLIKPSEEELKMNAVYEDYLKEAQKSAQPPAEEPKKK